MCACSKLYFAICICHDGSYADTSSAEEKALFDINASAKGGTIYGTMTDDSGDPVYDCCVHDILLNLTLIRR